MTRRSSALAAAVLTCGSLAADRASADCPQVRPTDPGGYAGFAYGADPTGSHATPEGRVRVWYATAGLHAPNGANAAEIAGHAVEEAIDGYAARGFLPPIGDGDYPACASNGGDARLDVYLVHFPGADGLATTERCAEVGATLRCSGFILVDSRLDDLGYASFEQGARTVLPHEYFHLVQDAYDAGMDRWWAEGTAQWATKQLHPELTDLERFLPAFFSSTSRSIDAPPGGVVAAFLYGTAVWPVFLSERRGPTIVREILEQQGATGVTPLDAVLALEGSTLAAEFTTFTAWNAATGARAGSGGYPLAASYPEVKIIDLPADVGTSVKGITSGLAAAYYRIAAKEPRIVTLASDASRNAAVVVPLEGGVARLDAMIPLPARVEGDAVIVIAGQRALKTDAPFTLRIEAVPVEPKPPPDPVTPAPDPTPLPATPPRADTTAGCSVSPPRAAPVSALGARWIAAIGLAALARRRRSRAAMNHDEDRRRAPRAASSRGEEQ
jgi:hypothetical protein